ncbi:MAG: 4-hydroxy-tetrahydrodipicolinate reductase [Deltaproteobacteria bacterium]|nr:4-hydroxy-tetrahydrodipicolinate reductase [Deltaproteobacteria bacterium]
MTAGRVGIALVGAGGRMGLEIARVAFGRPDAHIVAAVERVGSPCLGRDLHELAGLGPGGPVIGADADRAASGADVVVDLSAPDAAAGTLTSALFGLRPIVCGTTGLPAETLAAFDRASGEIPVLVAPNLSLGVAVLAALAERAVTALGLAYDIEIVEMHHRDKTDAPSGTALMLANVAARAAGIDASENLRFGREGRVGARPQGEIGVHAVRGGGVFGDHTVILAGKYERLELTHRADSRTLFAQGALAAALFLHGKPPGRYTMAHVLGLG